MLHGPAGLGSWPAPAAAGDETLQAKGVLARGVFAALWGSGVLNFGAIQRLGRIAKEPGRQSFCAPPPPLASRRRPAPSQTARVGA